MKRTKNKHLPPNVYEVKNKGKKIEYNLRVRYWEHQKGKYKSKTCGTYPSVTICQNLQEGLSDVMGKDLKKVREWRIDEFINNFRKGLGLGPMRTKSV